MKFQVAIRNRALRSSFNRLFRSLPVNDQKRIESKIRAVGQGFLESAYCPFLFYGRYAHELIFEPMKMRPMSPAETVGALASALAISALAAEGKVPLSDRAIKRHTDLILDRARKYGYFRQVSAFIHRLNRLEDEEEPRKAVHEIQNGLRLVKSMLKRESNLDRVVSTHTLRDELIFELEWLGERAAFELKYCKPRNLRDRFSDLQSEIRALRARIRD